MRPRRPNNKRGKRRRNRPMEGNLFLFNNIMAKWLPYAPVGNQVPGTRFIAFKVPLKESFVDKLKPEDRFTISILLDRVPELGLIIDLTQTVKYYNKNEVLDRGVDYVKIPTPGQSVPAQQHVDRFFEVVDYYLDTHKGDGSLIGVHCTHGVNRTGYMLCRYLIQRLGYSYDEAVDAVGTARGHMIERSPYLTSLRSHTGIVKKKTIRGDLEEGKPKMPKKSAVKSPKKPEPPRPIGKERFGRREAYSEREMARSRSPIQNRGRSSPGTLRQRHSPIRFDDRDLVSQTRSMMSSSRERPQGTSVRDRLQPPLQRMTRTPPPSMRGLSPPHHVRVRASPPPRAHQSPPPTRGRSPLPLQRGRTPPLRGRTPPSHMQGRGGPPIGRSPSHMRGRSPPQHVRGRTPPTHVRGRTPPPHSRGRTPPMHVRGRTPPSHMRGRTPPAHIRGRSPPPVRGRTPPLVNRGRSSPPPQTLAVRVRTPPPPHIRGRTPPPSHVRGFTPPGISSRSALAIRDRSPPASQVRGRSPQFHTRGRSPLPASRGRTPPPIPRGRSPIERSGRGRTPLSSMHRRPPSPSMTRGRSPGRSGRSPTRSRSDLISSHPPSPGRRDAFPPPRGRSPPSSRRDPAPRGRTPPPVSARRSPVPDSRREMPPPDNYYYRDEFDARRSGNDSGTSREYSDRFHSAPSYSAEPSSSHYYSASYESHRRERSRSPHRRDNAYYSDRREIRKELSPGRDLKKRRKSPGDIREKSRRSPPGYINGREIIAADNRSYQSQQWDMNADPDCREILNEKRSLRDPYTDSHESEYDDRRRAAFLESLPPKDVDLRDSLEEEKRRKQGGYNDHYTADEYMSVDRKKPRRDYPDPEYQHTSSVGGSRSQYDYQYPAYQPNTEPFPSGDSHRPAYSETRYPEGGDTFARPAEPFPDEFRRPRGRGGKRIFDRLSRGGGRGRGGNRI